MSEIPVYYAVLFRSHTKREGKQQHLVHENFVPVLFPTRKEATAYIKAEYGLLAKRSELRKEPYGWRMPIPVRVHVELAE